MGKIQENALSREQNILKKIRSGEVSFRSHFGYEHIDWCEIVDFLLTKIQRQIMKEFYNELKSRPYQPVEMPGFDDWFRGISKKGGE